MKINDEYTVKIEKLTNLGLGIGRIGGMVVFVEKACPGDEALITITKINKSFARAKIKEIITPSQYRVKPLCPLHNVCGGCQIQYMDYQYQLQCKKDILQDALLKIGNIDIEVPMPIPSPEPMGYRCKVQYPIAQTKVSKRIMAGYFGPKSHKIVNIKYCPIQPAIFDTIIEFIRKKATELGISGYHELYFVGELRHVAMRYSKSSGRILVTFVVKSDETSDKIKELSRIVYETFPEIGGVCVSHNNERTNVILGSDAVQLYGSAFCSEKLLDKEFRFGPQCFFQVNPKSAENFFRYIKDYIQENFNKPTILDAYAGVAVFGILLSDIAEHVVCVEGFKESVRWARKNVKRNHIQNIEVNHMDAERFFARELNNNKRKFNISIIDPPRKGSTTKALDCLLSLTTDKLIYVSCNPATLARDLKYLISKGAKLEKLQGYDLFCQTFHVETVAIIDLKDVKK